MSKTIHFNTGRKYTILGQRITATLHDDGVVTFYDHDRHVDGAYTELRPEFFGQQSVMTMYDNYRAPSTQRSWEDAFSGRQGCNSEFKG